MLHLGAICCCPDVSGKSTEQPNTALSPSVHMVPVHMDCRCPQRNGGTEDLLEQGGHWPCPYNTGDHCPTLRRPQSRAPCVATLSEWDGEDCFPLSAHLISCWLVFVGWRKGFLFPEQGKAGRQGRRREGRREGRKKQVPSWVLYINPLLNLNLLGRFYYFSALQMEELKLRMFMWLAHSHRARDWRAKVRSQINRIPEPMCLPKKNKWSPDVQKCQTHMIN